MDICIGCMQGGEMKPLLPLGECDSEETLSWNDMYMSTTQLQINQKDGLPEQICVDCKDRLLNSFTFRTMCHESYVKLKRLHGNVENDIETCEDTKQNVWKSIDGASSDREVSTNILQNAENQIHSASFVNDKSTQISAEDWTELFDCPKCHQQFTTHARLKVHKKTHLGDASRNDSNFKIPHAKQIKREQHKVRKRKKKLNNKNNSVDVAANDELACCMCDVKFSSKSDFDKHQRSHKKRKNFNCAKCEGVFNNAMSYETHDCKVQYCCGICNKSFTTLVKLNKHNEQSHKEGLNNETESVECKPSPDCNNKENYCENKLLIDCNVNGLITDCDIIDNKTPLDQNKSSQNEDKKAILDLDIKVTLSEDEDDKLQDSKLFVGSKVPDLRADTEHSDSLEIPVKEEPLDVMFEETDWDSGTMLDDPVSYSMEELYADDADFKKLPKLEKDGEKVKRSIKKKLQSKSIRNRLSNYPCGVCESVFPSKLSLKKHRSTEHSSSMDSPFHCSLCNKQLDNEQSLEEHKATHHASPQIYQCEMCTKKFYKQSLLSKHMWQHMEEKPFKCNVCSKGFMNQRFLDRHKTALHSGKGKNPKIAFCETCGRGFTTAKYLETHMRMHNGDRTFTCEVCDKSFNSKWHLKEHSKWHSSEKPFLCSECGQSFIRSDYLVIHMRRHNGEKPYKCKFCDKGFPRATDLTVHERYHTGEKTHLCTVCGKGFQRQYNLTVHLRVHTGEKPYVCTYCGKTFAQGNDLKSHVRRHTGERFNCEVCNEGFIQAYHLTQHKRTIHGIDCPSNIRRILKLSQAPQPMDKSQSLVEQDSQ